LTNHPFVLQSDINIEFMTSLHDTDSDAGSMAGSENNQERTPEEQAKWDDEQLVKARQLKFDAQALVDKIQPLVNDESGRTDYHCSDREYDYSLSHDSYYMR
jgi:hypothetical protein